MTELVPELRPGPTNTIVDVPGIRVGHHTRRGDGWLTGTTVVLPPPEGAVAGVDVRGGGPGTRETDLLDPRANVTAVHGIVLTGGSAYGLAAADGVMQRLGAAGTGYVVPVLDPGQVVPIVPAAVVFDLARGGDFGARPDAAFGAAAYDDASDRAVAQGCVGVGTGARAGGLKGGVGSASAVMPDGSRVGALVVVNAVGSAVDPRTGELYGARCLLPGEVELARPDPAELEAAREVAASRGPLGGYLATTLAVVATDLTLTKAGCTKLAGIGHDGLARAVRPLHTMFDGDTVFAVSTAAQPAPDPFALHLLLDVVGDCVTRAVVHAMLAATTTEMADGPVRSYADALPSALVR